LEQIRNAKYTTPLTEEKDSQAIADVSGASLRAVQLLIKELQEKDLIEIEKRGRSIIPCKAISKIATYYAQLKLSQTGEEKYE
jgi:predicted transcriptional regulator